MLESLGPAALVVMALTAFALARTSMRSGEDLLLAGGAALLAGGFRLHPALVLLLAGLYGLFKAIL